MWLLFNAKETPSAYKYLLLLLLASVPFLPMYFLRCTQEEVEKLRLTQRWQAEGSDKGPLSHRALARQLPHNRWTSAGGICVGYSPQPQSQGTLAAALAEEEEKGSRVGVLLRSIYSERRSRLPNNPPQYQLVLLNRSSFPQEPQSTI